jgi:Flp pilus assembly protein TadD
MTRNRRSSSRPLKQLASRSESLGRGPERWVTLALIALTIVAFGQVCDRGFQFINLDDDVYVTENRHVKAGLNGPDFGWAWTTFYAANWHPLTWLSLQLDATLYGSSAWGFHLTNLVLHCGNVVLLFVVLRRMTGAIWRSAAVAALFAVHPLHVESVAWVAERKDVLSTLFWMLTLLAYVQYVERPSWPRYLLMVAAFVIGLLAKPMLVTLPCVLLLLDWWPLGRVAGESQLPALTRPGSPIGARTPPHSVRFLVLEKVPLFILAAASCVVTVLAQKHGGTVATLEALPVHGRVANALVSYGRYLGMTLWPTDLAAWYPFDPTALTAGPVTAAVLLLLLVTLLALREARRRPYLIVGWLWYLGTLVPVIGLVQVGMQALADRYTYVPLIGIFIALVWGVAELAARHHAERLAAGAAAVLIGALTVCTWLQVTYWHDRFSLWHHALDVTRINHMAENNLGTALAELGKHDEALAHFLRAREIKPDLPEAHNNLGLAYRKRGELEQAIACYTEALRLNPRSALPHINMGVALTFRGDWDRAAEHFAEAARLNPENEESFHNLAVTLGLQGKFEEALAASREALRLRPADVRFRYELAYDLYGTGRIAEAESCYREALAMDRDRPRQMNQTAWTLATHPAPGARNAAFGVRLATQTCQATGFGNVDCLDTLAAAYAEAGRFEDAAATVRRALALPGVPAELKQRLEEHLRLFQDRQPVRQSPPGQR